MRFAAAFLSLPLVFASLAGCIGTASATAMDREGKSTPAAKSWNPNAVLAGIMGVEGTFQMGMWSDFADDDAGSTSYASYYSSASTDKKVGDGKCSVWVYRYVVSGQQGAYIVVVKDGKVVREGYDPDHDATPIGEWRIDSDEALRIAKENNEGLRRGVGAQHFGVAQMLEREGGKSHATWTVAGGGGDASGGGGGKVVIDAVTGAVLENQGGYVPNQS